MCRLGLKTALGESIRELVVGKLIGSGTGITVNIDSTKKKNITVTCLFVNVISWDCTKQTARRSSVFCVVSTQSQVFCATFNEVEMLHD